MTDHKPNKCYYKPNRSEPRRYSAKDVARIICYARKYGADQAEIVRLAVARGCWEDTLAECEEERELLRDILVFAGELAVAAAVPQIRILEAIIRWIPAPVRRMLFPKLTAWLEGLPAYLSQLAKFRSRIEQILSVRPPVTP